jgi:uncharacterized protein (TIGR03663 family)
MKRWLVLGLLVAAAGALALRLPQLGRRPMHGDEAVHALKLQGLWQDGVYRYNPNEYHGPVLYYATLPFAWLSRAGEFAQFTEATLRIVPVVFGVGLIVLLPWLRDGLGNAATLSAAALTAISPAMVFYSRYYIHETLLVFFTLLLMAAGWRYWRTRRLGWAVLAGAALGLLHATKETCALALGAMLAASVLTMAWGRWVERRGFAPGPPLNCKHLVVGLAVALAVSVILFSSFFTNASGPLDSLGTYSPWLSRAGGNSAHNHAWYFYFQRLLFFHHGKGPVWSEALIMALGMVGLVAALMGKGLTGANVRLVRFLGFYALTLTFVYSLISYKTPWCALGFWHGTILMAGVGAAVLVQTLKAPWRRVVVAAVLSGAAGQLAFQAWRTAFPYCADRQNPYVYAHTSPDIWRLVRTVEALAAVHPQSYQVVVKVMAPGQDFWPLPWYLRRFKHVGWWDHVPADPDAPIMIVGTKFGVALGDRPDKTWAGLYELRPMNFLELYVASGLWEQYLRSGLRPSDEHQ